MEEKRKTENGHEITTHLLNKMPVGPYEFAVRWFMNGLITGDFSYFERDMDKNAQTLLYGMDSIHGRAAAIEYWEGWRKRWVENGKVTLLEEAISNYNSLPCLVIQKHMLVMFEFKDGKTIRTLSVMLHTGSRYSDTNMLNYRLDYDSIKPYLSTLKDTVDENGKPIELANRVPCMWCDIESHELNWYSIRIPGWNYNAWSLGQVSVCPKCGRVIEFEETKSITSDEERDVVNIKSKYSDEVNEYAEYARSLFSKERIENLDQNNIDSFTRHIESKLTALKIDEGWILKTTLPNTSKDDDVSHLVFVNEEGFASDSIRSHCTIEKTGMGAWQLYLMQRVFTVLPTLGHGGYSKRDYIFKETDIDNIIPLKYHDLSKLKEEGKLVPSVEIIANDDNLFAVLVHCCYWSDWEGLVRESVSYLTNPNKEHVEFERVTEEVLFQFHCGIYI